MPQKESWRLLRKKLGFRKKEISLAFVLLVIIFVVGSISKIKIVECYQDSLPCPEKVQEEANTFLRRSYFTLTKDQIENHLKTSLENTDIQVSFPSIQKIIITGTSKQNFVTVNYSLIDSLPTLSFESTPTSTISAYFFDKPSTEISLWSNSQQEQSFNLWENGRLDPVSTASSKYHLFSKAKKSQESLEKIYSLIKLLEMYTYNTENYFLIENTLYLQKSGAPDIIFSTTQEADNYQKSLQSLDFLNTIKKDPKIIDLRYKNPIIR